MTTLSSKLFVLAFGSIALAAQACTLASPTEVTMVPADGDEESEKQDSDATESPKSTSKTSSAASSCKLEKVDFSKATACGDNKAGHCWPKSKVPGGGAKAMACASADEVCVPDVILSAGGGKLKTCTVTVLKKPGVCNTLGTLPDGQDKVLAKSNLQADGCDEGLVCQPCTDIRDGSDTGLCGEVGVSNSECSGDVAGGGTTTPKPAAVTCCGGKGTCSDLGEAGDKLEKDTCTGSLVCAPDSLTKGQATKCSAIIGDGICMDGCFSSMLKLGGMILGQDKCATGESCIPCMFASQMAPDGAKVPGCE